MSDPSFPSRVNWVNEVLGVSSLVGTYRVQLRPGFGFDEAGSLTGSDPAVRITVP